uniref:Saposin B-type domain-containing protein n=1 Tax=Timema douglasi TaxID=61478 RepID=A0A7R8VD62_TIMDO|nr:unnamed protein product [Timema douglasi]
MVLRKEKAHMITGALFPAQGISLHEDSEELHQELTKQRLSGVTTPRLQQLVAQYSIPTELHGVEFKDFPQPYITATCALCKPLVKEVLAVYNKGKDAQETGDRVITLCVLFNVETREVCTGLVDVYLESALYLAEHVNNDTLIDGVCGLVINSDECHFQDEWTVDVDLGTKPDVVTPAISDSPTVTVVQVTDLHYDPKYTSGGNAVCGEPTCCRSAQGSPADESSAAGYWGDYRDCDMPLQTVTDMLTHIKQTHQKIDYVYFTGDIIDHGVWETSQEFNTRIIKEVVQEFNDFFGDIPVIFTLGNHEPTPVNMYAPLDVDNANISSKWLFELVADIWPDYLTQEAKETILNGGFYTVKLRDGFRVIVLNNIVCYNSNVWLVYESKDPYGQLKWLAETLLQAEKDGEKVHILQHIPTGSKDCVEVWSREYHKIVDRFENTITAQFNGHTHKDEFQIFYSLDNVTRANNVAFNGGSGTTYSDVNTNYKVYTIDPSTWYALDSESWVFNLTEANLSPDHSPDWFKLYSFRQEYGVKNLLPAQLDSLAHRMAANHTLIQQYQRFYVKVGDPSLENGCNDDCMKSRLCDIVTAESGDSTQCDLFKTEFETALKKEKKNCYLKLGPVNSLTWSDDEVVVFDRPCALRRMYHNNCACFSNCICLCNTVNLQDSISQEVNQPLTNGGTSESPPTDKCTLCVNTVKEVYAVYEANKSRSDLKDAILALCNFYRKYSEVVCAGSINVHLDMIIFFAEHANNDTITRRFCSLYLPSDSCEFEDEWVVDVDLGTKPDVITPSVPGILNESAVIVHVSDLHFDPTYTPGNNAACDAPTCCKEEQGRPTNPSDGAGYWGDYRNCDSPLQLVNNTLQHIKQHHQKIDYVYFTGDFVYHGMWESTKEQHTQIITSIVRAFNETFQGTPVFFALGNHEPVQANAYAPLDVNTNVSTKWLFELVSELWSPYITEDAKQTILQGGFYTVKPRDGFRVIVLNNIVCLNNNYWLAYDSRDPYNQLKWLAETLLLSEREGDKVHILYHVPSGMNNQWGSCLKIWGREFHKIVDRFENIVAAHFTGHTHYDEFHVFYSTENATRANGVSFNGGSGTPFIDVNPNYKTYTVDPASWNVVDSDMWIFNLTDANSKPDQDPDWFKLYSFRDEYGVANLLPAQLDSLAHRMAANHTLLQEYYRFYVKNGDPSLARGCDDACLKEKLCEIVTVESGDLSKCEQLDREFQLGVE